MLILRHWSARRSALGHAVIMGFNLTPLSLSVLMHVMWCAGAAPSGRGGCGSSRALKLWQAVVGLALLQELAQELSAQQQQVGWRLLGAGRQQRLNGSVQAAPSRRGSRARHGRGRVRDGRGGGRG